MAIRVRCLRCGKTLKAPDAAAGKRARCPACQWVIQIPVVAEKPALIAESPSTGDARPRPAIEGAIGSLAQPPALDGVPSIPTPPDAGDQYRLAPAAPEPPRPMPAAVRRAMAESLEEPPRQSPYLRTAVEAPRPRAAKGGTANVAPTRHTYRYFVFLVALLPLGWHLLLPPEDIVARIQSTLEQSELDESEQPPEFEFDSVDEMLDQLFRMLPGHKLLGAHLARDSRMHWLYAAVAVGAFLGLTLACLPRGNATARQLLAIGFITSTGGVVFLVGLHILSALLIFLPGGFLIVLLLFGLHMHMSEEPFLSLFLSFTFGVGLPEEFTKSLPVLFRSRDGVEFDWRGAGARGFASGVGFGVAEAIMYAANQYNGIATLSVYLVRFISCVTLHAVWSAAAGMMIWRYREQLQEDSNWKELSLTILKTLAVPMTLHGLYNAALTKDWNTLALVAALASFGWLALQIELILRGERAFHAERNVRTQALVATSD